MFHLGESQELYVVKEVGFGIYLGEEKNAAEKVLLPKKEVPEGIKAGDILEVFLYKDSQDRLIATTRTPKVRLGETAVLRVADTGKIGAFLDWEPVQHHLRETSARRRRIRSPAGGSLHYIVHPQYRHPRHLRIQLHQGGAVQPCRLWRTQSALYMGQEK